MSIFPPRRRGTALAIWSMTTLVAPVMGPLLGGYISDNFSWPWIFLINVPVGIADAGVCWARLPQRARRPPQAAGRRHRPRAAVRLGGRAADHARHRQGRRTGSTSTEIVVLAVVSRRRLRRLPDLGAHRRAPDRRPELFPQPQLRDRHAGLSLGYAVFFGNVVILPLWLQTQLGYTATWPAW